MPLKSNIEQFVEQYLKKFRNSGETRNERVYVEKALAQINFYLDKTCCEDPEASIDFARRDSPLTLYIHAVLANAFDRRRYRRSLLRVRDLLENFLVDACCPEPPGDGPGPD